MTLGHPTRLPAAMLYALAFNPQSTPPDDIAASLDANGWLTEHPAILTLRPGSYPLVDGCHRLCHLKKQHKLATLVPVIVRMELPG